MSDDFNDKLDRASEAFRTLVTSQNSATEKYFEVDHQGTGTCEACGATRMRTGMDVSGVDIVVCKSCGHERPVGGPRLPPSPWTKFEV